MGAHLIDLVANHEARVNVSLHGAEALVIAVVINEALESAVRGDAQCH